MAPFRNFAYTSYQLTNFTDFKSVVASRSYDSSGFVASVTDFNGNVTNFANQPWTGAALTTTYPLTPSDSANGWVRATSGVTYGSANCPDTNNRDGNNPYYVYTYANRPRRHHKRGLSATYSRDINKRVTTINYPDGGSETFTYTSPLGQVKEHRLKTGGLETYTSDGRGMLTEYRDSYHLSSVDSQNSGVPANATPTVTFSYYTSGPNTDLLQSVKDFNGNVTSFTYNARGQLLTNLPQGSAHPVTNTYNTNGTLASSSNELQNVTTYGYDNYKRLTSVVRPAPTPGATPPPATQLGYNRDFSTTANYNHADANPWLTILPSGEISHTAYDNNNRKLSVTVAPGSNSDASFDQAVSSFTYDNNGNLQTVTDPNSNKSGSGVVTTYYHDQQNRLTDMNDRMWNDSTTPHQNSNHHTVSYIYDQANNMLSEQRTNNQLISYVYDSMNHVKQVTVPQTPDPKAVTLYNFDGTGLMKSMQDPNGNIYSYSYDLMGRKTQITYPSGGGTEKWVWDLDGNLSSFTNRANVKQTFYPYDQRERLTGFSRSDGTSSETIKYDDASEVTEIDSADATIKNNYFDDGSLQSQEEWSTTENMPRIVSYTYDADLRRLRTYYPGTGAHNFINGYTTRGQFYYINDQTANLTPRVVGYDHNENLNRSTTGNVMWAGASYNAMDEMQRASFFFTNGTRTIDYGYDEMNDRTSIIRDGVTDTFGYDLNEQSTSATQNGVSSNYAYDANGNRTGAGFGVNNLNQYTSIPGQGLLYDTHGNITNSGSGTGYAYDAQNRITSATVNGNSASFKYDGLNRKISQTINGVTTYNVWDGWNLIQEYNSGSSVPNYSYVYAVNGIAERIDASNNTILYLQDALGSTSHVTDSSGNLIEYYKYDRFGQVTVTTLNAKQNDVRHLFTGQLWMPQIGLYDYRNRVYSPTLERFMQTDPAGRAGDFANMYRYCGNNAGNRIDPLGLGSPYDFKIDLSGGSSIGVIVDGSVANAVGDTPSGAQILSPGAAFNEISVIGSFNSGRDYGYAGEPGLEDAHYDLTLAGPLPTLGGGTRPSMPSPPSGPPSTSVSVAFGPVVGGQITFTYDQYGQTFISVAGQIGKSWPLSVSMTGNSVANNPNPSASQIAESMRGFGWSGSAGYWFGGQESGPATLSIFNPFTSEGAGPVSTWGFGLVTPQAGVGLGYTWQGPTMANRLPPYSSPGGH